MDDTSTCVGRQKDACPPYRLQEHGLFAAPEFLVEEFVLYASILGRKGASHTVEQAYALAAHEQGTV